ncbi:MAG: hypothetical protein LBU31_01830 [Coriobacteriales bacterium]|nr:hypothetical protein [Coriobacteriales bacterium]
MALLKQVGRAIPVNPLELLKTIGTAEEQSTRICELAILVDSSLDPALLAYAKQALCPLAENLTLEVTPFFDELPVFAHGATAAVVLAAHAPATGDIVTQAQRAQIPVVVLTLDAALLQQTARDNGHMLDASTVITAPCAVAACVEGTLEAQDAGDAEAVRFAQLFEALGAWIVRTLPDERLALARALGFARTPFIKDATQAVAVQNAAIAALFFLPGADMPLLTLNQMRLFLQIAAAYDATLDIQRFKELAVVLLGGFGLRGIARRLVGVVPVLGWAIRGAIGYTGTLVVSKAAQEYFKAVR